MTYSWLRVSPGVNLFGCKLDLLLRLLAPTIPESYTGVPFLDQTGQT